MPEFVNNNKERMPYEHYTTLLRQLDPAQMAARCGLRWDGRWLTVPLMDQTLRISLPDYGFDGAEPPLPTQILLLRYLTGGALRPSGGSFRAYRDMPWGEVYFRNFQGRCLTRLAWLLRGKLALMPALTQALGGTPLGKCDAGFAFDFMPGLRMQLLFWDADEEFPPSAQILFSDNFPAAFSAEDMAFVGDLVIGRCKALLQEVGQ